MIINTDTLLAACVAAQKKSGESYLSVRMDVVAMDHGHNVETHQVEFECYTPMTGHTAGYSDPFEAIKDTLAACSDPQKLRDQAAKLQEEARQLLARAGGAA